MDEITRIITAFDEKTSQVLIDAQILELKPSESFKMGVDWNYLLEKYFTMKMALPMASPLTGTALFLGTSAATPTQTGKYKAILDVLQTVGDTKIISSPRIMAMNKQEAKILVGTKQAYITSTTTVTQTNPITTQTVNFVDVGIQLYVTPEINRDGFVAMKIRPVISSSETQHILSQDLETDVPIVTTSEAETTVMVKDGVTIIIGGLRKDNRQKTVKKIPLLGDIPLLGAAFRNTSDTYDKTELIILLTPHIMSGEKSYADFAEIKPKDGVTLSMEKGKIITEKTVPSNAELPLEPHSLIRAKDYRRLSKEEYYQDIKSRIQTLAAIAPHAGESGTVTLSFTIGRDGSIIGEPHVVGTSSNENLDTLAISTLKTVSPFPAFPDSLEEDSETFRLSLLFE